MEYLITIFLSLFIFFIFVYIPHFLSNFLYHKNKIKEKIQKQMCLLPIQYYRDIPFDNLEEAYWSGLEFGLLESKSDLIGAFILKWVYEKKIKLIKLKNQYNEEEIAIDFTTLFKTETMFEAKIYGLLLASANNDKILFEKELINLLDVQARSIHDFFSELNSNIKTRLINNNSIDLIVTKQNKTKIKYSDDFIQKVSYLRGLKNFLNDFSRMKERESIEVHLWEQYMVYAQLFGITDKIEKEFDDLYPVIGKNLEIKLARTLLSHINQI